VVATQFRHMAQINNILTKTVFDGPITLPEQGRFRCGWKIGYVI
jgi:hypothetical protein